MAVAIEIVSADPEMRMAAARAFTAAPPEWSVELRDVPSGAADVVVDATGEDGAVAFDARHPEETLEEVGRRLQRPGSTSAGILVAGAAGGAGTTTVALHLAALWGRGACYADLTGGVTRRVGLPRDARTWLPNDPDCSAAALPVSGGFRVMCAPAPCPETAYFPLAPALESFERVVLDAGTGRGLEGVVAGVRAAVVVTTPTRPAAERARELVEAFPSVRWAVVSNRTGAGGQIMRRGLEAIVGRPLALELPCCPALRDAEDEARLLDGRWRRWSRGIERLARALDAC